MNGTLGDVGDAPARAATARQPARTVAWVVTNLIHYHHARMTALARRREVRPVVIEISDRDAFRELEYAGGMDAYQRHTLFPGLPLPAVDGRRMARLLHERLDAVSPDAVCINGWSRGGCFAALDWCARRSVPAIVMSDSNVFDAPRRWQREEVKRRVVRLCGAGLVAGSPQEDYLAMLGMPRSRIFHGYDVVDNAHFARGADAARSVASTLRKALGLPGHYFMAASRMIERKNLPRLVEAYAIYRERAAEAPWSLVIVGDGPQRAEIGARIAELGLSGHVHLPGFLGYHEMPVYYGLASAFIHASLVDQWGLVVNEAMAAGVPVLVSRTCGCARDLVRPGDNGDVFDPADALALARAMVSLAARPPHALRDMGAASRRLIERFSPDAFCDGLMAAMEAAAATSPPPPRLLDSLLLRAFSGR